MSEVWDRRDPPVNLEVDQSAWIRAQKNLALALPNGPAVAVDPSHPEVNTWAATIAALLFDGNAETSLVVAYRRLLANPHENNDELFNLLVKKCNAIRAEPRE